MMVPSSVPPTSAGASDRAGFTDAPLNGIPAKWMAIRVSGIAKAAWFGRALRDRQDHEQEDRRRGSPRATNALAILSGGKALAVACTAAWLATSRTTPEAAIAPITWATT